jgi:hypothetical protein
VGRCEERSEVLGDLGDVPTRPLVRILSRNADVQAPACRASRSNRLFTSTSLLPSNTCRSKATANSGSIPLEHPAMRLSDPVGAMAILVAFRNGDRPLCASRLRPKFG